ncbi:MAG: hypothetical protein ACRDRZ_09050 [Pseudonocardiaceae bacterium]
MSGAPEAGTGRDGGSASTDWREKLRRKPYATDWRAAIGEQLSRLDALICRCGDEAKTPCGVDEALETARHAITVERSGRDRARAWWSGWDAERAWRAVHTAEVELVKESRDLADRMSGIREQVAKELPANDQRHHALKTLQADSDPTDQDRAVVADAMRAAFAAADDALRGVRSLRNQMLVFGALLTVLNLFLLVLGRIRPELVPLCVPEVACPSGPGAGFSRGDVGTVQLFGVLGAVVAVVVLLVRSRPGLITYQLPFYQSLVKITLGATLAVVGVLGITVGAFETVFDNQASLLFAALLLGYAQQVATRFLDATAERLVGNAKTGAAGSG